ncbi:glycosyltransferase [Geminocystis herdmanii]|uniref:glycosyltransferase n=1 Tax=Geminocystis herdmanii TaxID=669359 RepID=UPI00034B3D96|nr:glycosyltransferase [Geminocystis herdmanii]
MEYPLFSVIIPTYARPQKLSECLSALSEMDYPNFEVVIVDDGSPMSLDEIIIIWQKKLTINLVKQENRGPSTARNSGVNYAKGKFLAFTDDDCIPTKDWLNQFAQQLDKTPDALVGGCTINGLDHNIYASTSQMLVDYLYDYYNKGDNKNRQTSFFTSNNFAVSKEIFMQIGGFSQLLTTAEDRELCDRALTLGYEMIYLPSAVVYHYHDLTLIQFWRQHFNYGRGAIHFNLVRAERNVGKIKAEGSFFYLNLFLYPFKQGYYFRCIIISGLLVLTQIAHTVGCFQERRRINKSLSIKLDL